MIRGWTKGIRKTVHCPNTVDLSILLRKKQLAITPYMRCYLKTECLSTLTFIEYIMRLLCHSNGVYISFHKTFGIVMLLCFQHLLSNTHGCCVDAQSPNSFFYFVSFLDLFLHFCRQWNAPANISKVRTTGFIKYNEKCCICQSSLEQW